MWLRDTLRFLTEEDAARIRARSRIVDLDEEQPVIEEGQRTRALHVLLAGELRVEKAWLGTPIPIAELRAGEVFGEMSLVGETEASATVVTGTRARISVVDGSSLDELFAADPALAARFYRSIADLLAARLRVSNATVVSACA